MKGATNMLYNFNEIEKKWQKYWDENKTFKVYAKDAANNETEKEVIIFTYPFLGTLDI